MTELVKPIEYLPQPSIQLDGKGGFNRADPSKLQINAINDFEAIGLWLKRYDESSHTFRSYRKEVERLYLWSINVRCKPFSSLVVDDIQDYLLFTKDPQPAEIWKGPRVPRSDPHWRPFEKPLSESSRKQVLTILGACFSFLVTAGYLVSNPVKLLSKSSRPKPYQSEVVERYIDQSLWQYFWNYIVHEPVNNEHEKRHYERNRFIFTLLYQQSPRANEVVNHRMNNIIRRHQQWWWKITGKGGKTELIPWTDKMMDALVRYRKFRQLTNYPSVDDFSPLVSKLDKNQPITAGMLYKIVKLKVNQAASALAIDDENAAAHLRQASTHWFRHTSLTHRANAGVDLRFLQALARHESLDTTKRYLHVEKDAFYKSINKSNT